MAWPKLLPEHQQRILDAFAVRENVAHFTRLVSNADLAENRYKLAVSAYVDPENTSETVDIMSLNAEIAEIVARQQALRKQIDAVVEDIGVEE